MQNIGYGTVLNLFYIPGTIIGGFLMDKIGRKQTMTLGFVLWSVLGFIIGGALNQILPIFPLFVVLYGIFNTLGEMGPGVSLELGLDTRFTSFANTYTRWQLSSAVPSPFPPPFAATSSDSPRLLERPALPLAPRYSFPFKTRLGMRTRVCRASFLSALPLP
jgi:MFS family permease